jgi:hypothetical protein
VAEKAAEIAKVAIGRRIGSNDVHDLTRRHAAYAIAHQHQRLGTNQPHRVDFVICS